MLVDNGSKLVYFRNGYCDSDGCFICGLSLRMLQEIIEVKITFFVVEIAHLSSVTIALALFGHVFMFALIVGTNYLVYLAL